MRGLKSQKRPINSIMCVVLRARRLDRRFYAEMAEPGSKSSQMVVGVVG